MHILESAHKAMNLACRAARQKETEADFRERLSNAAGFIVYNLHDDDNQYQFTRETESKLGQLALQMELIIRNAKITRV